MNIQELKQYWLSEEKIAYIHGWDFSHINDHYTEDNELPWSYEEIIHSYLKDTSRILDIDTGGGEFLLSLGHPYQNTSATEGYPPNIKLCEKTLLPLGIDFRPLSEYNKMPFPDNHFDLVINRHGDYDVAELYRILKPNGIFITQQVGDDNDRELAELLLPNISKTSTGRNNLKTQSELFQKQGFTILRGEDSFGPIRFFDIGALVWFARIIPWEFPGFSVETCFEQLLKAQELLEKNGSVDGTTHRYLIVAQK